MYKIMGKKKTSILSSCFLLLGEPFPTEGNHDY